MYVHEACCGEGNVDSEGSEHGSDLEGERRDGADTVSLSRHSLYISVHGL